MRSILLNSARTALCGMFLISLPLGAQPFDSKALSAVPSGIGHSKSISATGLWPDSSEFSLTGQGYTIYQWEAAEGSDRAHADTAHPALAGRISYGDVFKGVSGHATDMALIAIGNSTTPDSSGVAYGAGIKAFSYDNRWTEMSTEAVAGMKLSLHAYASNYGWGSSGGQPFWWGLEEIDSTEDYHFGLYDSESLSWDTLVYQNPYTLIVKAAGNHRGQSVSGKHYFYNALVDSITADTNYVVDSTSTTRPPDGGGDGYDCLPPGSVAKNILTVGAVEILNDGWQDATDVVARPSTAFGPVDDGRIKPDVVAAGDKTSHSAAAVAGVLALMQEHYQNTHSSIPRASTLKALLIHTADEAGQHPGPDYKFGWGMVNSLEAARHISDTSGLRHIFEDTLTTGDTLTYHFYATGAEVKASLCWTDPRGMPVPFLNSPAMLDNPLPMLVNDLDMRLVRRTDGDSTAPYRLSAANPVAAATRADNNVDNVEHIEADQVEEGWYSLYIYHKNSLQSGSQIFSLLVSGGNLGLVWDGTSWEPKAPGANTQDYDVLILRDTSVTIPPGFKARNFIIEPNADVEIR